MLLTLLLACTQTLDLPPEEVDTSPELTCEPHHAAVFVDGDGVYHHFGTCTVAGAGWARFTLLRVSEGAVCTTVLSYRGDGNTDCEDCLSAWGVRDAELTSDCSDEMATLSEGPEDLVEADWIGVTALGEVRGEVAGEEVRVPGSTQAIAYQEANGVSFLDVDSAIAW